MQRVRTTERTRRSGDRTSTRHARAIGLAASVTALMALAACTSGSAGTTRRSSSSPSTPAQSATPGDSSSSPSSKPSSASAVITTSSAGKTISPATPVSVAIAHGKLSMVKMVNPAGKSVSGALAADGSSWHTTEDLGYAKTYSITASGTNADGTPVSKGEQVKTLTPANMTMPAINTIYGTSITNGAAYGVGMVVRVTFDESVNHKDAERTLQVSTSPKTTGSWFWDDNKNVYWRPQHYYAPGTQVTVKANAYGQKMGTGLYGQADQSTSFTIGAKHVSIADAKTHHVQVYFDDKLQRSMPTSMGRGGTVQGKNGTIYLWTMPGTYTVINHENPATMSSDSYGLPANSALGYAPEKVYWSTKISTDGIYLHELDTTVSEQGHSNVSHGCLNLNLKNAKWFYQNSRVGDIVTVVHSGGPKLQFWQGGQWSVPWSTWVKGSALH